ncbi:MAG: hypothetical protein ABIG32_02905 [Candidatus Uhrbacteria bacterium]
MKLKEFFTLIIIVVLLVLAGAVMLKFYFTETINEPALEFGTVLEAPPADGVYTNPLIGFGFRYPSRYEIVDETLVDRSEERDRRVYELAVTLEAKDLSGKPRLTLYINQEVPIERASRTLTLLQDDIGVYLAEISTDQTFTSRNVRTIGSIVMSDDNVYTWEFVFERGEYDYTEDLKLMLSTFGIYRLEEPVEILDETEEIS